MRSPSVQLLLKIIFLLSERDEKSTIFFLVLHVARSKMEGTNKPVRVCLSFAMSAKT